MKNNFFEWDDEKAAINISLHGISFEEAITVMADDKSITVTDGYYEGEVRYRTIGMSGNYHVLIVVWTVREPRIRVISAWKASKARRDEYERNP